MSLRRTVLLVDFDENRQSETRFLLRVNEFSIVSANSADSARKTTRQFDVVLAYWPCNTRMLELQARRAGARFILVCPRLTGPPPNIFADAILLRGSAGPRAIVELLRTAVVNKPFPISAQPEEESMQVA